MVSVLLIDADANQSTEGGGRRQEVYSFIDKVPDLNQGKDRTAANFAAKVTGIRRGKLRAGKSAVGEIPSRTRNPTLFNRHEEG